MNPERIQFRTGDPLAAKLAERTPADAKPDLIARRDLERFYGLLAAELRTLKLTDAEAYVIVDALNGTYLDDLTTALYVHSEIAEAVRIDDLDKKHGVPDRDTFLKRIAAWTPAQRFAVADAVQRWWIGGEWGGTDLDNFRRVGLVRDEAIPATADN
ncbi:hypothetical protein ABN028_19705 [Actinopolymorpha sp. B17G11]|uniref:hypothetical protein n=1 Tax=Actinopolymorpha sp. B17G11 TaxID=3160861 RepID=UPI0032E45C38